MTVLHDRNDNPTYIRPKRAREIANVLSGGGSFPCHRTVEYDDDGEGCQTERSMHCAGAMIVLAHEGRPNLAMRFGALLDRYDPRQLVMDAPVFRSMSEWVSAHRR